LAFGNNILSTPVLTQKRRWTTTPEMKTPIIVYTYDHLATQAINMAQIRVINVSHIDIPYILKAWMP
jgi:hypothetical protein